MDYDDLLAMCESEIESHLLGALYPNLGPDAQKEIEAQRYAGNAPRFCLPLLADSHLLRWLRVSLGKRSISEGQAAGEGAAVTGLACLAVRRVGDPE